MPSIVAFPNVCSTDIGPPVVLYTRRFAVTRRLYLQYPDVLTAHCLPCSPISITRSRTLLPRLYIARFPVAILLPGGTQFNVPHIVFCHPDGCNGAVRTLPSRLVDVANVTYGTPLILPTLILLTGDTFTPRFLVTRCYLLPYGCWIGFTVVLHFVVRYVTYPTATFIPDVVVVIVVIPLL